MSSVLRRSSPCLRVFVFDCTFVFIELTLFMIIHGSFMAIRVSIFNIYLLCNSPWSSISCFLLFFVDFKHVYEINVPILQNLRANFSNLTCQVHQVNVLNSRSHRAKSAKYAKPMYRYWVVNVLREWSVCHVRVRILWRVVLSDITKHKDMRKWRATPRNRSSSQPFPLYGEGLFSLPLKGAGGAWS